jgi:hypothetical protein
MCLQPHSNTQGARDGKVAASFVAGVRGIDEARVRGVRQEGDGCRQLKLSGERLRQVVEAAGRYVLKAQQELMHVFTHEGYATGWERILPWRTALRGKAKRKAADRLLHFISARRGMIRYPEFRERGWQIGSGPTESQCKLCTKRLKGHGRRWDRRNATAVAALDTLDRNGQWRQVWPNARCATT